MGNKFDIGISTVIGIYTKDTLQMPAGRMMSKRNRISRNPNNRGKTTQRNSRRSAPVLRGFSVNQPQPSYPYPTLFTSFSLNLTSYIECTKNNTASNRNKICRNEQYTSVISRSMFDYSRIDPTSMQFFQSSYRFQSVWDCTYCVNA